MGRFKFQFQSNIRKRDVIILIAIVLAVATLLLFIYLFWNKPPEGYIAWKGVIDHIDEERDYVTDTWTTHAFARYTYEGKEYISELDNFNGSMTVGMTIDLFLNPNNPAQISTAGTAMISNGLWIGSLVLYCIGAAIAIAFAVVLIVKKHRANRIPTTQQE